MANENAITKIQLKTKITPDGSCLWVKLSDEPKSDQTYTLTTDPTTDNVVLENTSWTPVTTRGIYIFNTDDADMKLYYIINDEAATAPAEVDPDQYITKGSSPINFNPLNAAISDLSRGEALVNTNNNTLIVQTTGGGENPIVVGQSTVKFDDTLLADQTKNSADIISIDSAIERSRKHISGNNNIKVSNNDGNLQISYTDYSSKLHFEDDYTWKDPEDSKDYVGCRVTGLDKDHIGHLVIPSTYNGNKVICVDFGTSNWYSNEITSISIPDSVKVINIGNGSILSKINSLKIPNSALLVTSSNNPNLTSLTGSISIPAYLVRNSTVANYSSIKAVVKNVNDIIITDVTDQSSLDLSGWEIKNTCTLTISGASVDCAELTLPTNSFAKLVLDCTDIKATSKTTDIQLGLASITNLENCGILAFSNRVRNIPAFISTEPVIKTLNVASLPTTIETIGQNAFSFLPLYRTVNFTNGQPLHFRSGGSTPTNVYMIVALITSSTYTVPESVKYIAPWCFTSSTKVYVDLHQDDNWAPNWAGSATVIYKIPKNLKVDNSIISESLTTGTIDATSTIKAKKLQVDSIEVKESEELVVPSKIHSTYNDVGFKADHGIEASYFNATSDARLKENFKEYAPEKSILDLPIYKFDFINGAKNQIGCKAQDLQEICPEIVNQGSDGYLSIQESKIVYLLLDEIKKLRKEIDDLKGGSYNYG